MIFALIAYETVYFDVDDVNRGDFEALKMSPFTDAGKGKPLKISDYEIPPSIWQNLRALAY